METWDAVKAEREELTGFLDSLDDDQWNAQSLCPEWRVRDVVAHLTQATQVKVGSFMVGFVGSGFRINHFLAKSARKGGEQDPSALLNAFRGIVDSRSHPPATKPVDVLTDTIVHTQDVRRPLGKPREIEAEHLLAVLERLKGVGFPLGAKKRIAGLKLAASDADWSTGDGPLVTGTGEALAMVMAGRSDALSDLSGEGKETLASRF